MHTSGRRVQQLFLMVAAAAASIPVAVSIRRLLPSSNGGGELKRGDEQRTIRWRAIRPSVDDSCVDVHYVHQTRSLVVVMHRKLPVSQLDELHCDMTSRYTSGDQKVLQLPTLVNKLVKING